MNSISLPDKTEMYQALVDKDASFEGVFITGVKTTGIFCRPTCTARKPKPENVEFFTDSKQALSFGYRPCKICNPMQALGNEPDWLKDLLKEVTSTPNIRLRDYEIRQRGIDPARIRRWFKKHHGMTFQAYLRALRINRAFGLIRLNNKVTDTALDSGYDSLSGFNQAFKNIIGNSPTQNQPTQIISLTRLLTPLGPMFAGATDKGICLLEFTDRRMIETQIKRLRKLLHAEFVPGQHPHLTRLNQQLEAYFAGQLEEFTVPLDVPGSDFQQQVWQALQQIPYGNTRSYQQQAQAIGNSKAVRAVARANGDNRIAIIIPCHRVIGKDGSLTGYGGGIWRKQRLLELEGVFLKLS